MSLDELCAGGPATLVAFGLARESETLEELEVRARFLEVREGEKSAMVSAPADLSGK